MIITDEQIIEFGRDCARNSLMAFSRLMDPKYIACPFHRYLGSLLEDVSAGRVLRLLINTPPQHGKSLITGVNFPAWMLGKNPMMRIIMGSYAQTLSDRNSRGIQRVLRQTEFREVFQTRLNPRMTNAKMWETASGGGVKSVGVGAGITGFSADMLLIDDPYKGIEDSQKAANRETVYNWFLAEAYTRLQSGAPIIICMTRWHVDDLCGRLLREDKERGVTDDDPNKWRVVKLPAIAEAGDLMGRQPGEALFHERHPIKDLREKRSIMTSYLWSSMYQQQPVQQGGNYVDGALLKTIDPADVPAGLRWFRFWDLATDVKQTNDFTASPKGAFGPKGEFYIAGMIRGKWKWPVARERMKAQAESEMIAVGIEAVGGFKTAYQNAREVISPTVKLIEVGVDSDKFVRALPWLGLVENGKVYLVNDGGWHADFRREVSEFPNGVHDDQVDGVSGVYKYLKEARHIFLA